MAFSLLEEMIFGPDLKLSATSSVRSEKMLKFLSPTWSPIELLKCYSWENLPERTHCLPHIISAPESAWPAGYLGQHRELRISGVHLGLFQAPKKVLTQGQSTKVLLRSVCWVSPGFFSRTCVFLCFLVYFSCTWCLVKKKKKTYQSQVICCCLRWSALWDTWVHMRRAEMPCLTSAQELKYRQVTSFNVQNMSSS